MTGFGRSELKSGSGFIRVEIKTVNHKYFELSSRLPGHLNEFDDLIRKTITGKLRRGKINLFISSPDPAVFSSRLTLNEPLAREVRHHILKLKKVLGIKEPLRPGSILREVLHYPDVLTKDNSVAGRGVFSSKLKKALEGALEALNRSRALEGAALAKDLRGRLGELSKAVLVIEKRRPKVAREYRLLLEDRIAEFLPAGAGNAVGGKENLIDKDRITTEVAQYVKNSDISEELTRFKSHIAVLKKTLNETGEVGRKIDFIAQEMTREANTLGAKSADAVIAEQVIQLKGTIEKIREQASNVE